jgi:hypothetical protein
MNKTESFPAMLGKGVQKIIKYTIKGEYSYVGVHLRGDHKRQWGRGNTNDRRQEFALMEEERMDRGGRALRYEGKAMVPKIRARTGTRGVGDHCIWQ